MIPRVAGTLIFPYEVHTPAIGTEVRTQFTLVDVCAENRKSKHPAISFGLWQGRRSND